MTTTLYAHGVRIIIRQPFGRAPRCRAVTSDGPTAWIPYAPTEAHKMRANLRRMANE